MYWETGVSHQACKLMQGLDKGHFVPLLFNIYLGDLLRRLNDGMPSGIKLNSTVLNMLLFVDDMAVIQTNENAVQNSLYGLNRQVRKIILKQTTKIVGYVGQLQKQRLWPIVENTYIIRFKLC